MKEEIEKKIDMLAEGLKRAERILKVNIPKDLVIKIERRQLEIIEVLKEKALEAVEANLNLEEFYVQNRDLIAKYYYHLAKDLELSDVENVNEAQNNLVMGRADTNGARILILVYQAIARAYSEAYEKVHGVLEVRTNRCPVCGLESDVIVKWPDGTYRMICPFCGYTWIISRKGLLCPRCGSRDPVGVGVFTDRERKVGLFVCQDCKFTAKIVLDESLVKRVPRMLLPLIALNGERFRRFLRDL